MTWTRRSSKCRVRFVGTGLWRTIAARFAIGNHTRTHPDLTTIPDSRVIYQITTDEQIVEAITGRPMLKVLRPPYGAVDAHVRRLAAGLGYDNIVLWDVDSMDSADASVAGVERNAERATNGSIILMHCGPSTTPIALPAIIRNLQSRGLGFVTIPTLLGLPPGP